MGVGLKVASLLIALMKGVFCQTWGVTMPRSIVGISDSCITVPCRFQVPLNEEKNILNCTDGAVWKKGDIYGPIIFSARNPSTYVLKGKVEGDVTRKNCTTMFNDFPSNLSDFFYFRLECLKEPKYSFQTGVHISVQADPPPPVITPPGQVSAGAQVRLQCSVPVPCSILPPSITWLPQDSSWQVETQMQQNVEKQMSLMSTLTFTASADHHNQFITCSASYLLTKGGNTRLASASQRLNILYAPKLAVASLSTSGPVSEGNIVTLTCSSEANPPVSLYTWYRVQTGNMTKMSEGEFLVFKVGRSDEGVYLCEAQNQQGSQRSTPVTLEVTTSTGSTDSFVVVSYILCGLLLVVCILIVVVGLNKYQSLSRRLKQVELKGEHTYADLSTCSVSPDYDKLQPQQSKTTSSPDVSNYENLRKSPRKPVSKPGNRTGPEGLC